MYISLSGLKNTDTVFVNCEFCSKEFTRKVRGIKSSLRKNKGCNKFFCSTTCANKSRTSLINCNCSNCGADLTVSASSINSKYRKTANVFCNSSCSAKYNNSLRKHQNKVSVTRTLKRCATWYNNVCSHCGSNYSTKSKKSSYCSGSCRNLHLKLHTHAHSSGTSRSKIEKFVEAKLKLEYKDTKFRFNDKTTIQYELDIYLPDLKLAFELNGVFHYIPIHGKHVLEKIQYRDKQKIIQCQQQGIKLHTIELENKYFTEERKNKVYDYISKIIRDTQGGIEPPKILLQRTA